MGMAAKYSRLARTHCLLFVCTAINTTCLNGAATFDQNYHTTWGHNNIIDRGHEVQLILTNVSGSGFRSILDFASGFFEMRIKIPTGRSSGVVTTFYLTSLWGGSGDHDELDFEFLGSNEGYPTLQTNVYTMDNGCREEQYILPFNPSEDFHLYQILWNQYHIVFYIDNIPIRVFNNYGYRGVNFPSQHMHIEATIWDGHVWASPYAKPIDWESAPFYAHYQLFDVYGCPNDNSNVQHCHSPEYWWNSPPFLRLNDQQMRDLYNFRRNHLTYYYCNDSSRNQRAECYL